MINFCRNKSLQSVMSKFRKSVVVVGLIVSASLVVSCGAAVPDATKAAPVQKQDGGATGPTKPCPLC